MESSPNQFIEPMSRRWREQERARRVSLAVLGIQKPDQFPVIPLVDSNQQVEPEDYYSAMLGDYAEADVASMLQIPACAKLVENL